MGNPGETGGTAQQHSTTVPASNADEVETFAEKIFLADVAGIYASHAAVQTAYGESLKILLGVGSLPLLAASAYLAATKEGLFLTRLPPFLIATSIITPVLAWFVLGIVISNRLTTLFYARMLNGMRATYLPKLPAAAQALLAYWPQDPKKPGYFEQTGPTGLVVKLTGVVCGTYAGLGVGNVLRAILSLEWSAAGYWVLASCVLCGALVSYGMQQWYESHATRYESFANAEAGRG
jgi:hypothetical protein